MRVTLVQLSTRTVTIDVDDEFEGMESSELEDCSEICDALLDRIDGHGWDEIYCHEETIHPGEGPDTLYLNPGEFNG